MYYFLFLLHALRVYRLASVPNIRIQITLVAIPLDYLLYYWYLAYDRAGFKRYLLLADSGFALAVPQAFKELRGFAIALTGFKSLLMCFIQTLTPFVSYPYSFSRLLSH
jgi:hypothetical protein